MYIPYNIHYIIIQEELKRGGYQKGHTKNNMEYCIDKYGDNRRRFKLEATDPNFIYYHDLPQNMLILIYDLTKLSNDYTEDELDENQKYAWSILLEEMNHIYESRKYQYEMVILYWFRTQKVHLAQLLDSHNICDMIAKYRGLILYSKKSLRISMNRYWYLRSPEKKQAMLEYFRKNPL